LYKPNHAQKNKTYSFPEREYKSAVEMFKLEQYGAAKDMFSLVYEAIPEKYDLRKEQSLYHMGICAAFLFHDDAEKIILTFIEEYPENAYIDKLWFYLAIIILINPLTESLHAYERIEQRMIPKENLTEYEFK
jgi:hypothetical protein